MIYLDSNPPPTLACHNCKTVTIDNGQTVWVCETCGEENHVPTEEEKLAQAAIDAAAAAAPAQTSSDNQAKPEKTAAAPAQ